MIPRSAADSQKVNSRKANEVFTENGVFATHQGPRRTLQPGFFNQSKITVGTSRTSAEVTSKYSLASAPVALAVSTCGNRRMKPL